MSTSTSIVIRADGAQAERTMGTLGNSIDGVSKKLLSMSGVAGTLGGALSLTAFATFVSNTIKGIDALNDMSDSTGASIENLSALEEMAARTGTSFDTVGSALIKFNQTLAAATPGSPAEQSLKAIGLSVEELKRLDPAEALRVTAVALSGFADDGNKARLVQELFGKSVREVAPLLKDLGEQSKLTGSVTKEMAERADQYNKHLAVLQVEARTAGRELVSSLLPALTSLSKEMAVGLKHADGLFDAIVTLGTINPAFTGAENIRRYGKELEDLEKTRRNYLDRGFSTAAIDADIADVRKKLGYLKEMQREAALRGSADNQTEAESRRLGDRSSELKTIGNQPDQAKIKAYQAKIMAYQEEIRRILDVTLKDFKGHSEAIDQVAADSALMKVNGERAQKEWQEQQRITEATIQGFNSRNQTLAEMVAQQDLTEEERILYKQDQEFARLEEEKAILMSHNQWTLEMEQQYAQARFNAQAQASKAFITLEKQTAMQKQQVLVSSLGIISSLMSNNNVALFRVGQAAAIANATISTYEGATKALGQLGVWGIPVAAAIVAAGLANVSSIASTKIGGGTPSPVNATFAGGSVQTGTDIPRFTDTGAAPNATVAEARQQLNINFQGSGKYTYDEVINGIIPLIQEGIGNGVDITVTRS